MYGYTVMNKSKHLDTQFCNDDEAQNLVNNPRFMSLEEFDNGTYEVNITNKYIIIRLITLHLQNLSH